MALERILELMQQSEMNKAAKHAQEGAGFLSEGKRDDAEVRLGEAAKGIEKSKLIDTLRADILTRLAEAGIVQLPVEYLRELFSPTAEQPSSAPVQSREPEGVLGEGEVGTRQTPDSGIPPVELPVLPIDVQAIPNLRPKEKALVENLPQNLEQSIARSELASRVFPNLSLDVAKANLGTTMAVTKKKLEEESRLTIINPVSRIENSRGVEARYYLTRLPGAEKEVQEGQGDGKEDQNGAGTDGELGEEAINNQLTDRDIYHLARALSDQERLEQVGVKIPGEDMEAIIGMRDSRDTGQQEGTPAETREIEILYLKLRNYLQDKPGIFMAQPVNGDAQFLLTPIAQIESVEKLTQLLGIPPEAEKK